MGASRGRRISANLSLDDFANYTGVRLRGNVLRTQNFKQQNPPGAESGAVQNKSELGFPEVFSLFTADTLSKNIGFFAELESNLEEGTTGIERAFIAFNNVGGENIANIRIGKLDPSAAFSFSTLRQQLDFVGESANSSTDAVQRAGVPPACHSRQILGSARSLWSRHFPLCPLALQRSGGNRHRRPGTCGTPTTFPSPPRT